MIWTYGEWVNPVKWQRPDVQETMAGVIYHFWETTAREAGYTPVDGTATETVVPLWRSAVGAFPTETAIAGQPASEIELRLSGEVIPTPVEPTP